MTWQHEKGKENQLPFNAANAKETSNIVLKHNSQYVENDSELRKR